MIYYLLLPDMVTLGGNSLFIIINCVMMFVIYKDRAMFSMSEEEEKLYRIFYTLSPGFRTLMRISNWTKADEVETITTKGEVPEHLFFILDGDVSIRRDSKSFNAGPGHIGELAFLTKNPATATVKINKNATASVGRSES